MLRMDAVFRTSGSGGWGGGRGFILSEIGKMIRKGGSVGN